MQRSVLGVGIVENIAICIWHIDSMAINMNQIRAISKSLITYVLNTTSYGDGGEAGATLESIITNACNSLI